MILVDTSVWIDFFNRPKSASERSLSQLIEEGEFLSINAIIEMEILQGVKDQRQFHELQKFLKPYQYYPETPKKYFDMAVEIYRTCRSRGVTVRRSLDCLIAAHAISENLRILHQDRDFSNIAKVFKQLKVTSL